MGDSGYIATELLQGRSALENKCFVVQQTVNDGTFSLEEALNAYGVSDQEFASYIINQKLKNVK